MRKIILGISILSLILTAGVMAVEASDNNPFDGWKEKIKARMMEFKEMTPDERKAQKEESISVMMELKESEDWQNADKEEQMKMFKELDVFPLRGHGKAFGKGFMKGHFKGMEGCECECGK